MVNINPSETELTSGEIAYCEITVAAKLVFRHSLIFGLAAWAIAPVRTTKTVAIAKTANGFNLNSKL